MLRFLLKQILSVNEELFVLIEKGKGEIFIYFSWIRWAFIQN